MPKSSEHNLPTPAETQRWKCVCSYDGSGFAGWQSQPDGRGIQDTIERRLAEIFGTPIRIHSSGRTDAGVHARAQVFHFDAAWRHGPAKLLAAFRVGLPFSIQINSAKIVDPKFHSRFLATGKIYSYYLYLGEADPFTRPWVWSIPRKLDFVAMEAAAAELRGEHDFAAYSAEGSTEVESTVRNLRRLEIIKKGRHVRIIAEADGFLYKMVRSLVGALVATGSGKLTPVRIRELLASGKRPPQVQTAPSQGLFLEKVFYPKNRNSGDTETTERGSSQRKTSTH